MQDNVYLLVAGKQIQNFISYSVEADLYTADHAFSLELANPEVTVKTGQLCELYINNKRELKGLVDRVLTTYDKSGRKLKVEGRDLCGLLVDSCVETFTTMQSMTLQALAQKLIVKVPFIQRSDIIYQQNVIGNYKYKRHHVPAVEAFDGGQPYTHPMPGQTIFEVFKIYAKSRGMMFYALPDGTFVFGQPLKGGEPLFQIRNSISDGSQNNALEGSLDDNISKRFSKVVVAGQQQGTDTISPTSINTMAFVTDPTFPFYKPFVANDQNDSRSPKLHAQMLMEKQKFDGFKLEYKVAGHNQNGKNWALNTMCQVTDDVLRLNSSYLIYGRRFTMSKGDGVLTHLRLSYPGMVQS